MLHTYDRLSGEHAALCINGKIRRLSITPVVGRSYKKRKRYTPACLECADRPAATSYVRK
ncbi:hypothetical protein C343_03437 [Cryptococcus neoformans C23]|uniref:Uncharacterized protein n=2 Tax=Cryptococcus neoformans TaxID=5207 RepID=A0A854QDL0_CRYNE|nr:hypothetical protein CNAG_07624 [Cryptococcus neoformans var. grubii H99]AUB25136.1 hypothetical protein CKF44_07624 [Cryptococcus neoformans var. grubii]OWZ31412.1 hypothetical protein C347_03500 [Cryptococcus neoformans var. grubii AD2-60a]OWZ42542.1 hypothetical protein C353_03343 [Cryptococcus neoformans var. grubii AD1-83a]OWZ43573.1 hypothetical protein C343_03437 [Cryptococcus neoformans var. grubii C23]OXC84490.1 hypothetical protein C344_03197 [Cryptococcus neoformans var. grubii A|eukprot:XP_012050237.1 hypothetical protein CNAG_07624 [Cryptococcus neoformans var. grubii H99]